MTLHTLDDVATEADEAASAAIRRIGASLRQLGTMNEFIDGSELLARVWGTSKEASPMAADMLASLAHAKAAVIGAIVEDRVIGLGVAVAGPPSASSVYGLVAGVSPDRTGQGVGYAIKQAQRAWALRHGANEMIWTFDPLVRRNAHFNLVRLGARVMQYLPDFYPPMHDALNRLDRTDRLMVSWDLAEPRAACPTADEAVVILDSGADGEPVSWPLPTQGPARAFIPKDIEGDRKLDLRLSGRWRLAQRHILQEAASAGLLPTSVTAAGYYLLERSQSR